MNMIELLPPPVTHDAEVRRAAAIADILRADEMVDAFKSLAAGTQAAGLASIRRRTDALVSVAEFIGTASLLECKHILNELADRVASVSERCNVERVEPLSIAAECIEEAGIALTAAMDAEPIQIDRAAIARDQYTEDRIDERLMARG